MEFVDPIYDKRDIPRFKKKLKDQVNGFKKLVCFEIGLQTGLRPSDLLNLTAGDVKDGIIRKRSKKRNKTFEMRLNDRVYGLVQIYIEDMEDEEKLFTFNRSTMYRFMDKASKDLNLEENIGAHSIRKTKAYHLYIDSGYDIGLVMDLLQHDEAGSTLHYIGWKKSALQEKLQTHDL